MSEHQQRVLTELELIRRAKEEAWDEGRKHGARYPYGERGLGTDDNPYRSQA